jgi:hypothetical protein
MYNYNLFYVNYRELQNALVTSELFKRNILDLIQVLHNEKNI